MNESIINIILFILSFFFASLVLIIPCIKNRESLKEYFTRRKDLFLVSFLLFIGCSIRVCLLDILPSGLNQDEASIGYEAYSLLNYGIDRNGMRYPMHFISWGSGQNALYAYIAIPFIKVFGNTALAIRLPMAIISCMSLYLLYFVNDKLINHRFSLVSLFILTIMPWHIMKSRYALESNLFPEMILQAFLLLLLYLKTRKQLFFYLSACILGLSSYSYGTSYFFLLVFVVMFLIYFLVKHYQKIYHCIIYILVIGIICIPIFLFIYINVFDKETIHFLWFDIPKLHENRFSSVTSLSSYNFIESLFNNLISSFKIIFVQYDSLVNNATDLFGCIYLFSLPFSLIGLLHFPLKKEKLTNNLFENYDSLNNFCSLNRIWFISSIILGMILSSTNINRFNVIWFPLILSTIIGVYDVINFSKRIAYPISILYIASFVSFSIYYSTTWNENKIKSNMYYGFKEALNYSSQYEVEKKYITSYANYALVLYYDKVNTNDYVNTVEMFTPNIAFENTKSFTNYVFSLPKYLEKNNIYILSKYENKYDDQIENYSKISFGNYYVINTLEVDDE